MINNEQIALQSKVNQVVSGEPIRLASQVIYTGPNPQELLGLCIKDKLDPFIKVCVGDSQCNLKIIVGSFDGRVCIDPMRVAVEDGSDALVLPNCYVYTMVSAVMEARVQANNRYDLYFRITLDGLSNLIMTVPIHYSDENTKAIATMIEDRVREKTKPAFLHLQCIIRNFKNPAESSLLVALGKLANTDLIGAERIWNNYRDQKASFKLHEQPKMLSDEQRKEAGIKFVRVEDSDVKTEPGQFTLASFSRDSETLKMEWTPRELIKDQIMFFMESVKSMYNIRFKTGIEFVPSSSNSVVRSVPSFEISGKTQQAQIEQANIVWLNISDEVDLSGLLLRLVVDVAEDRTVSNARVILQYRCGNEVAPTVFDFQALTHKANQKYNDAIFQARKGFCTSLSYSVDWRKHS